MVDQSGTVAIVLSLCLKTEVRKVRGTTMHLGRSPEIRQRELEFGQCRICIAPPIVALYYCTSSGSCKVAFGAAYYGSTAVLGQFPNDGSEN